MADEPQTRLEDAEDEAAAEEDTAAEEDAPAAEDALEDAAPVVDPDEADAPAEGDDTTATSDEVAVPEDPSDEEEVHDIVTADELDEKEEPEAAAEEDEEEEEEEEDEEPEAAAEEEEDEEEEEEEDEEPEAAAEEDEEEEEDEEDEEPEAAAEEDEDEEEEEEEDEEPEAAAEEEEDEEEEEEEDEEPEPDEEEEPAEPEPVMVGTWYAIQTYSGHENKVQKLIQRRIEDEPGDTPSEKEIREVLVPTQEVVEIRNGKRVTVTKRLYPGYVLVNMELNDRTMHTINNIQGVIKFVGAGTHPQPLRDEEIKKILGIETGAAKEEEEEEVPFHVGQVVEVTQGPFSDFSGTVQEVYADKGKAKVEVSLFGRPTSVELDFTQLKGY